MWIISADRRAASARGEDEFSRSLTVNPGPRGGTRDDVPRVKSVRSSRKSPYFNHPSTVARFAAIHLAAVSVGLAPFSSFSAITASSSLIESLNFLRMA